MPTRQNLVQVDAELSPSHALKTDQQHSAWDWPGRIPADDETGDEVVREMTEDLKQDAADTVVLYRSLSDGE